MTDSVKVSEEARGLRMNAYYFAFNPTGVELIDRVLSAIACAGKAYHHTEKWNAPHAPLAPFRGASYAEFIQNAATDAAEYIASLEADRRRLNELETLADMGSLHMTEGRIHLFRPSLGLWELFDTLRESADAALTTQEAEP